MNDGWMDWMDGMGLDGRGCHSLVRLLSDAARLSRKSQ